MISPTMFVLEEYALLKSIGCGGFTNMLQDAVFWFSSGGTKSVLHYDAVDNINCLFDGTKELLMINKSHLLQAHIDKVNGAFSSVDVDKVDMYKFPGLQTIPYYKVLMEPGDCLFIPARWVHQVRSYGQRNLAVNIWWAHFVKFNQSDCESSPYKDKDLIPLSQFDFHPQEAIRQGTLQTMGEKPVNLEQWLELIQAEASGREEELSLIPRDVLEQNFHEIDSNKDGFLSSEEIYHVKYDELERLLGYVEEDEEQDEEDNVDGTEEQDTQPEETSEHSTEGKTDNTDHNHMEL